MSQTEKAEEFITRCGDDFEELLRIPAISVSKKAHQNVPYEYATTVLRNKRDPEVVDRFLGKSLNLALYCFKNSIPKDYLLTIAGGNLWLYYVMKSSFGGGK